ncbi:hypothetical protein EC988_006626, partial [Linderina pennispora]
MQIPSQSDIDYIHELIAEWKKTPDSPARDIMEGQIEVKFELLLSSTKDTQRRLQQELSMERQLNEMLH